MSIEESDDPRMDHIKISAQQVLEFDSNHWQDLIWKEENKAIIKDFFDTPSNNMLLIYFDQNTKLTLSFEVPKRKPVPKQLCIFLKNNTSISVQNCKQGIAFYNVLNFPLKQYQMVFEKIITPIFCCSQNNRKWPDEIAHDICCHFQDFKTTLSYHVGLAEGKTVLMIPETAKLIDDFDIDNISECDSYDWKLRNILNSITEMLSNWIPIVRDVLEITSEQIFSQKQEGPSTELKFWNDRKCNLEFIHNQVNIPIVRKMVLALEKTNNCHFPKFRVFLQNIAEGVDEAREICINMEGMSNTLKELDSSTLLSIKDILPKAMKIITDSWMQSKYYKSVPSCITVLLQKINCLLTKKVHEYLDPNTLLKKDRSENTEKVKYCLDVINLFLKWYYEFRDQFKSSELKPYPWEFPDQRVFSEFEKFIQRLKQILEVFEAAEIYFNLPSHKLCNVQQALFRVRMENLKFKFADAYYSFEQSNYNPLDINSTSFIKDYEVFLIQLKELDTKLGILLGQIMLSFIPAEDSFKLFEVFQDILKRPLVQMEFKNLITFYVNNVYNEVFAAHQELSSGKIQDKCDKVVYRNLPPVSAAVQWLKDQNKMISSPVESLKKEARYFEDCEEYKYTLKTYKEVSNLLSEFEKHVSVKWKVTLDDFKKKIDEKLFIIDEDTLLLNFDYQISEVAEEVRYLKQIKEEDLLSTDALKFSEKSESLLLVQSLLACSTRWYNDLKRDLIVHEKALICKQWNEITSLIENGYSKTWNSDGLLCYAEKLYSLLKSVYESVNQAKRNILMVQESINLWNTTAMFIRENSNSLIDFNRNMKRVENQIASVKKSAEIMKNVLQKNQKLFKSDPNSDEWEKYTIHLESLLENGIKESIACSLEYILENTNSEMKKLAPFYKISLILDDDVKFIPPLDKEQQGNLFELFETVLENIYSPAKAIKRVMNCQSTYYEAVCQCEKLKSMRSRINKNILAGAGNALKRAGEFSQYSEMWLMSIKDVLEDFVLYGPLKVDQGVEDDASFDEVPLELKPPTEEEFKIQIFEFDQLYKVVEDIPIILDIESWLIMDVSPFKERLLSIILNWCAAYKKKLIELKRLGKLRKLEEDSDA